MAVANAALGTATSAIRDLRNVVGSPDAELWRQLDTWIGVNDSVGILKTAAVLEFALKQAKRVVFQCSKDQDVQLYLARPSNLGNLVVTLSPQFFAAPERGYMSRAGYLMHNLVLNSLAGLLPDDEITVLTPDDIRQRVQDDRFIAGLRPEAYAYLMETRVYDLQQ